MGIIDFSNRKDVLIIAELSANHKGSLDIAIETIRAAKRAGADAIKLQTYTADTLTIDSKKNDFIINNGSIWDGKNFYELYQEAYTPWEWHSKLFEVAKEEGLMCFSSPFDKTAVDFLEELEVPCYKIASFEITDIPLIEYVASKGKPIILSTGIATLEDIELALKTIRNVGNNEIALLKCTSSYPAPLEEANLVMIEDFKNRFDVTTGLSDHTLGSAAAVVATCLGAKIIEKHFILNHSIGGPDASFSLDEKEFTQMVQEIRAAEKSIGNVTYELTEKQKAGKAFSRSLYVVEDIKKGTLFTGSNIRSIRPGFGLHPKYLKYLIGKEARKNFTKGDRLTENDLK
ncbi:pseudaminic acid synthase [Candidatus Arcticimaribacter forsetii]|uniref:pseudaminic acid synthase n=1 Tax=Candidatus Arcticimaribacter forsetii TaxID=2820661 RepID=UPI0020771341|nr:pseudaminic acid synthase [Candidatus Arcticimaribacter forsetii]MDB2329278.1 pseudaminic acid synthase [Flavobacteriaceae bacterium]MDB4674043.1 pseudaminic acid synthase [Flavobacteriaceae bacterium]